MLLTESEVAKKVRARILDIVISTINRRTGGGTKFINIFDNDFLPAANEEANRRKNFTGFVTPEKFDRFIGKKSIGFDEIMNLPENREVLKRLKQAEDE